MANEQSKSDSEKAQEAQLKAQREAAKEPQGEAKPQRADKLQKHSSDINHAVHVRDGEYVQGPRPKEPASGSKSVVVMSPDDAPEYPDGTHPVAPPEEQYWSAARVEKFNQLSGDEKNVRAEERTL